MELTILGKYGPYGKKGSGAASGYLVSHEDENLLLDFGSGVLTRLIDKIKIEKLSAIFISHLHFDHTSDLLPFRYLLDELKIPVTTYTHKEISPWYDVLFTHPLIKTVDIDGMSVIDSGKMTLTFFKTDHPVTNHGIRVSTPDGTLVYTGDTRFYKNLPDDVMGADLVLADCAKPDGFIGGHMTAKDAVMLQKISGARIIATHIAPGFDPENLFSNEDNIEIAEEGKTYKVTKNGKTDI